MNRSVNFACTLLIVILFYLDQISSEKHSLFELKRPSEKELESVPRFVGAICDQQFNFERHQPEPTCGHTACLAAFKAASQSTRRPNYPPTADQSINDDQEFYPHHFAFDDPSTPRHESNNHDLPEELLPREFGLISHVNIDISKDGEWISDSNRQTRIWRMIVQSPGARALSLHFSEFYIPSNAVLNIYGTEKSIGPLTGSVNTKTGRFATAPLIGDTLILEYIQRLPPIILPQLNPAVISGLDSSSAAGASPITNNDDNGNPKEDQFYLNHQESDLKEQATLLQSSDEALHSIYANKNPAMNSLRQIQPESDALDDEIEGLEYLMDEPSEVCPNKDCNTSKTVIRSIHTPKLVVSSLVHAYDDPYVSAWHATYGRSGNCHMSPGCSLKLPLNMLPLELRNAQRSVGMMITEEGHRYCTGTLLNNGAMDGRQLFLTAAHCTNPSLVISNAVVVFNFVDEKCSDDEGNAENTGDDNDEEHQERIVNLHQHVMQAVHGLRVVTSWPDTDFALLEIMQEIPDSYNVYYAGWSRSAFPPSNVIGVHHPSGDPMKMTYYQGQMHMATWKEWPMYYHWAVPSWSHGVTEPGSSGSPLFLQDSGLLIGYLNGGNSSCLNQDGYDIYGSLMFDWDSGPHAVNQIKWMLDPRQQDLLTLNGAYYKTVVRPIATESKMFDEASPVLECTRNYLKFAVDQMQLTTDEYLEICENTPKGVFTASNGRSYIKYKVPVDQCSMEIADAAKQAACIQELRDYADSVRSTKPVYHTYIPQKPSKLRN